MGGIPGSREPSRVSPSRPIGFDPGRVVPPHASGGDMGSWCPRYVYRSDPDETEGRRLYRNYADALVRIAVSLERRSVRLKREDED